MVKRIHLENFKCFEKLDVDFNNINILTGINGMGKSTVIQAMLLIEQSWLKYQFYKKVSLNEDLVRLGRGRDILYEAAEDDSEIIIGIENEICYTEFHLKYEPFSSELMSYIEDKSITFDKSGAIGHFCYLSAYRIQPQEIYNITDRFALRFRNFGNDGMYALQYLKEYGSRPIEQDFVIDEDHYPNSLYHQVRRWMNMISPGVSIDVEIDDEKQLATLGYSFTEGKNVTNTYNCVNVGFGITYVLPVIISLLSAQKGDVIILENPEAHIHPAGQRKLGELIAWVGKNGVQVIVETHSDHILNGIRISVKNETILKESVNLMYFYKDNEDGFRHKYMTPRINDDGRIDQWPKGFFDEWDNALLELL